jgi:WhiB family transcriptional regulator, redox-sensing transcriptional regulator
LAIDGRADDLHYRDAMIDLTGLDTEISMWQERAACLPYPAVLFFGMDESESSIDKRSREKKAKSICAACGVRRECLRHAMEAREPYGIWGGLNEVERRAKTRGASR